MTDVKQLPEAFLKEMEQLLGDNKDRHNKKDVWQDVLCLHNKIPFPSSLQVSVPGGKDF